MFNGIVRLRRDNDYNYEKIKNTFVPADGEVCLVDTASNGLRAKVGNGTDNFASLPYSDETIIGLINDIVVRGYYLNGAFYLDAAGSEIVEGSITSIYIDVAHSKTYTFDGTGYVAIGGDIPNASATVAGITKLYDTVGQNTDGTMTQKAITDELGDKVEVSVDTATETVVFSTDN